MEANDKNSLDKQLLIASLLLDSLVIFGFIV